MRHAVADGLGSAGSDGTALQIGYHPSLHLRRRLQFAQQPQSSSSCQGCMRDFRHKRPLFRMSTLRRNHRSKVLGWKLFQWGLSDTCCVRMASVWRSFSNRSALMVIVCSCDTEARQGRRQDATQCVTDDPCVPCLEESGWHTKCKHMPG